MIRVMPLNPRIRRVIDGVLSVAWAPVCATCDVLLETPTQGVVCGKCWRDLPLITAPVCNRCGDPISSQTAVPCGRCHQHAGVSSALACHRAVGWYEGTLRSVIHAFKYQGRRSLASPLAALMRQAGQDLLDETDVVVPVPLHARRRWERGFNQAAELAAYLGPPVVDALRRTRATPPQATLPAGRRRLNVGGAFGLNAGRRWLSIDMSTAGRTVVVVDDVMTTGATLEACAKVLQAAGAREVSALTVARVAARPRPRSPAPPRSSPVHHRRTASLVAGPDGDSFL